MPNPPSVAGAAAHLYYCLNHVGDGLDELDYFRSTMSYLHMGQELFRLLDCIAGASFFRGDRLVYRCRMKCKLSLGANLQVHILL